MGRRGPLGGVNDPYDGVIESFCRPTDRTGLCFQPMGGVQEVPNCLTGHESPAEPVRGLHLTAWAYGGIGVGGDHGFGGWTQRKYAPKYAPIVRTRQMPTIVNQSRFIRCGRTSRIRSCPARVRRIVLIRARGDRN